MKRLFAVAIVLICFTIPALAQDFHKAEVFGGFSVLSAKFDGDNREQPLGWQASFAGNANKVLGLVADFGGQYKTIDGDKVKVHEYLFGPRFNARMDKATVFAHALFGGVHFSGGGDSSNKFAMGYGGGLDVKAGSVDIRVVQFDWIPVHVNEPGDNWEKSPIRFGFGVVIPVGKK